MSSRNYHRFKFNKQTSWTFSLTWNTLLFVDIVFFGARGTFIHAKTWLVDIVWNDELESLPHYVVREVDAVVMQQASPVFKLQ